MIKTMPSETIEGAGRANCLPDLMQATERANKWLDVARPIIKAMFAVEEVEHLLNRARFEAEREADQRTFKEAASYLARPQREWNEMLDGIRCDFLADETPAQPANDEEQAWQDRDEWTDALAESVTTVEQAVKIVTDEHNRSFGL